ncbi:NAD(P)H-quinone oxidoreductase subunit I, chloroplastic [bioreactor metagenome]|uniref:NAD(P)H-quinone oxidoreductase subunit I, chloroplastic n=1 Tax=bioreactor metagenome TaxID=1076179 RepID=A0A645E7B6_9ZZZZ
MDICETASPDLTIMDAVVGMEGDGPSGGHTRKIGALLVSQNPHALDYVATSLIGFDHKLIPTLVAARGKGIFDFEKDCVEVIGESIEIRKIKDFLMPGSQSAMFSNILPDWAGKIVGQFFTPKPVVDESKCIGCGACARICPAQAAQLIGRKAAIDRSRCIKCYCCHEVCPPKAIILKSKLKFWK